MIATRGNATRRSGAPCCARCGLPRAMAWKSKRDVQAGCSALAGPPANVPAAALFDEMPEAAASGYRSGASHPSCAKEGLHGGLLPFADVILEQPLGERFVMLALKNTRRARPCDKPVSPAFLFASCCARKCWQRGRASKPGVAGSPQTIQAMEREPGAGRKTGHTAPLGNRHEKSGRCSRGSCNGPAAAPTGCLEHPRFSRRLRFSAAALARAAKSDAAIGEWVDAFPALPTRTRRQQMLIPEGEPRSAAAGEGRG